MQRNSSGMQYWVLWEWQWNSWDSWSRLIQAHKLASLSLHKGTSPDQVFKHLQLSRTSKRHTGSAGLFGPQQSQVVEPRFPRPWSRAVVYSPHTQHGALQTPGVMQVRSGPCWEQQAVSPPVSIATQAGAVPVSLALWLHWVALLPGREQSGELCEDCPCHSALFPEDMMGDVLRSPCWVCCAQYTWRSSTKVGTVHPPWAVWS